MPYKWRDDLTVRVIENLKEEELLWNNKLNDYRNRDRREVAVKNLVEKLNLPNLTTADVKLKIRSIRTRYTLELGKVLNSQRSATQPNDVYKPRLQWFDQADAFLRSVCAPKLASPMQIAHEISESRKLEDIKVEDINEVFQEDTFLSVESPASMKSGHGNSCDSVSSSQCENSIFDCVEIKKRKITQPNASPPQFPNENISESEETKGKHPSEFSTKENEFDYFAKSLAVQLKNMPLYCALLCQEKLQKVMTDARLELLSE